MRIGAIEAGGTKFVCGIGNEEDMIADRVSFPTELPEITIGRVIEYFKDKEVDAIGIGTFGPIYLDPSSSSYGYVTTTPKPGWAHYEGCFSYSFRSYPYALTEENYSQRRSDASAAFVLDDSSRGAKKSERIRECGRLKFMLMRS